MVGRLGEGVFDQVDMAGDLADGDGAALAGVVLGTGGPVQGRGEQKVKRAGAGPAAMYQGQVQCTWVDVPGAEDLRPEAHPIANIELGF